LASLRPEFARAARQCLAEAIDCFEPPERHGVGSRRRFRLLAPTLAFVFFVLIAGSAVWLGDQISQAGSVMSRFVARLHATQVAQALYPGAARERILVVLIDDEYLQALGQAWPIGYQDHADFVDRLTQDPRRLPASLFWDVTFSQARREPGVGALAEAWCRASEQAGVPVYVAALATEGRLRQRPELEAHNAAHGGRCFRNVAVDLVPDPLDGIAWTYPVQDAGGATTAAVAIHERAAGTRLADRTTPIALDWGLLQPPGTSFPASLAYCAPGVADWSRYLPRELRWVLVTLRLAEPQPELCPYHETISAARLADLDDDELAQRVAGRHVMVGGFVPGQNDFVTTPVHGLVPGVYYHAMALDNLLSYGQHYRRHVEWSAPNASLLAAALAAAMLIFVMHTQLAPRMRSVMRLQARRQAADEAPAGAAGLGRRVVYAAGAALFWAARLAAQLLLALALLAFFHALFDIGLVAVTELVTMVLVIEGIGLLALTRWLFLGPGVSTKE